MLSIHMEKDNRSKRFEEFLLLYFIELSKSDERYFLSTDYGNFDTL